VLDMATTVVAAGKLEIARRRGEPIPEGWAVDEAGRSLTDVLEAFRAGALLPLGGGLETASYKGFGLALAVDLLTGALSGFGTSTEIEPGTAAHGFAAIRIDAFQPLPSYLERVGTMIDKLKAAPGREGGVRIPGEVEQALSEERRAAGMVPLHGSLLEGFRSAAEELGLPFDAIEATRGAAT
jgi:LDH2 family malate/lactate/ureidoglycolate dehydrogenase